MAQDTYVTPSVRASGTTFAQFQAGGLPAVIANMITANTALTDPTVAATVAVTGGGSTGGLLPAGVYFVSYTWVNGFGESLAGASEVAAAFTVSAGNIPRVTIPSLPTGASCANIYLTAASGASGTEKLYARGVTGTTYDLAAAAGLDATVAPPTVNRTSAASVSMHVHAIVGGLPHLVTEAMHAMVSNFLHGDPIGFPELRTHHGHLATVLKMYAAALDEIGVLIAANPGTLTTSRIDPPGTVVPVRTFP